MLFKTSGPRAGISLSVLGVFAVFAVGCSQALPVQVAPAVRPVAPEFAPPAVAACPPSSKFVWRPGAEQLLVHCQSTLELRDAISGSVLAQRVTVTPGHPRALINAVTVSPDGSRVALSFGDRVELRELPSLDLLWSAASGSNALEFVNGGRELRERGDASRSAFSVADGRSVAAVAPSVATRWQNSSALNAEGTLAFKIENEILTIFDASKDVALRSFQPPNTYPDPVWIGPYLGFRVSNEHSLVDARDPKRRFTLEGLSYLTDLVLSSDGARLRSFRQGEVLEWHLGEAQPTVLAVPKPVTPSGELSAAPEPVILRPAWSSRGLMLTSEVGRQTPMLVSFPAGTAVAERAPKHPPKAAEMPALPVFNGDVHAWAVNADRSVLAVLDANETVNTFSLEGGLLARLTESASALFSSEDASVLVIVAADSRSLTAWDTHTWQPRVELPVAHSINTVAISRDGARLAVLDGNGDLEVVSPDRSLRRYQLRRDIAAHGLSFDPSGQYLALGGLPFRIVRLTDGAVLYGYGANEEHKDLIALAWLADGNGLSGDPRALEGVQFPSSNIARAFVGQATFVKNGAPRLLETFFGERH